MNAKLKAGTIFAILFVLFGLLAAAPSPAFAAVEGCTQTHTVVGGENLSKIAALYGTTWPELATLNKLEDPNLIYSGQVLCIFATSPTTVPPTSPPPLTGPVRVYAASSVEDKAVTLKGKQLDANSSYTVYLSNYKKAGSIETLAGTAQTDASGNFTQVVTLPKSLVDISLIMVRIVNSRGDQAANWYINTSGSSIGGIGTPDISIAIDDVEEGDWVKISVSNLPSNVTFQVYIAKGDSSGAVLVGQIKSGDGGGKVTATFDLPSDYLTRDHLELQLESEAVNMEAAKKFDN